VTCTPTKTDELMIFTISQAKQILSRHGFRANLWGGAYTVSRLIPEYGVRPLPFRFHRDHRGFQATHVTVAHVRRLAEALHLTDTAAVTAKACGAAVLADRKAQKVWAQAGELCRCKATDDTAVAELRTGGASRMLKLVADVMRESWQQHNQIKGQLPQEWATTTTTKPIK